MRVLRALALIALVATPSLAQAADTTAPTGSISSPANNATVSGTVNVTASASDNVGVVRVEFYIDGGFKAADSASPYSYSWDTTKAFTGWHSVTARIVDGAGNAAWTGSRSVYVNNASAPPPPGPAPDGTAPTVALTNPGSNATVSGTVDITATASDNVGVSRVEFYIDGTFRGSDSASPYAFSWNTASAFMGW